MITDEARTMSLHARDEDVLSRSTLELLKLTGCGYPTVTDIIDQCCQACIPPVVTGLQLLQVRRESQSAFRPTTLADLDKVLHGGLPAGTVTEIAGPSGCGKTQFSIMLSVLSAMSGDSDTSVVYIDTEGAFSAGRLVEVARSKFPSHFQSDQDIVDLASRVHVDSIQSCISLMKRKALSERSLPPVHTEVPPITFDETTLPSLDNFYSSGTDSTISVYEYEHAQDTWEKLGCHTLGYPHDLYLRTDVLLLADLFRRSVRV
ncbi:DNA repair protein RAD51 homolog 2-like [Haliotis asinina]|uniref:DNA repair protein RAD51 homolog 2-like n=1 Tax=Haliotis asinina TaxID=109174 RepID=UPI003531B63A